MFSLGKEISFHGYTAVPSLLANLSCKLFCWLKIVVSVWDDTDDFGIPSMDKTVE